MNVVKGWGPRLLARWCLALAILLPGVVSAQQSALSETEKRQYLLIWAGQYSGLVDGVWGPNSNDALTRWYVGRYGRTFSYLSPSQQQDLIRDAASAAEAVGLVIERDPSIGMTFAVPTSLLSPWHQDNVAVRAFRSSDGRAQLNVEYLAGRYASLDQLYRIRSRKAGRAVEYERYSGDWFVLSGTEKDQAFYERYAGVGDDIRGFSFRYPAAESGRFSAAVVAMSNLFRPSEKANDPLLSFAADLQDQLIDVVALWDNCLRADDVGAKIRACTGVVSLLDPAGGALHLAYFERASALAEQRRWDSAIRDYSEAIRLRPNYGEAFYGRAEAHRQSGANHETKALFDYRKAVQLLASGSSLHSAAERWIAWLELPSNAPSAILYEEPPAGSPTDAKVTAVNAAVAWRFVTDGPGGPEIEATLMVPERNMTVTLAIRRSADETLHASHLVEVVVNTPGDFLGKSIGSIPRIVLKPTESARGQPLVGAAAKVAEGFFWIALSAAGNDTASNVSLLRERNWIDLPFVYENGQRGILTFEKGPEGRDVFRKAEAIWASESPPAPASTTADDFEAAVVRRAEELRSIADAAAQKLQDMRDTLDDLETEETAIQKALASAKAEVAAKDRVAEALRVAAREAASKVDDATKAMEDAEAKAASAEAALQAARSELAESESAFAIATASRDKAASDAGLARDRSIEADSAARDEETIVATMRKASEAIRADEIDSTTSKSLLSAADRAERNAIEARNAAGIASAAYSVAQEQLAEARRILDDAGRALQAARANLAKATETVDRARNRRDEAAASVRASELEASAALAAATPAADAARAAKEVFDRHSSRAAFLAKRIQQLRENADGAEREAQIAEAAALTAETLADIVRPNADRSPPAPAPTTPISTSFSGGGIVVDTSTRTVAGRPVAWVTVKGSIEPGDEVYFNRALLTIDEPTVIVSLESPGGDVETGIKIGRTIWNNQYQTVVESGGCYSMCAYIWLAGRPRFMSSTAQIGFHAPWKGQDETVEVSSVGSAIVGGYLADLGITSDATAYMTAPGPADIQILSQADAERLAISVLPWQ